MPKNRIGSSGELPDESEERRLRALFKEAASPVPQNTGTPIPEDLRKRSVKRSVVVSIASVGAAACVVIGSLLVGINLAGKMAPREPSSLSSATAASEPQQGTIVFLGEKRWGLGLFSLDLATGGPAEVLIGQPFYASRVSAPANGSFIVFDRGISEGLSELVRLDASDGSERVIPSGFQSIDGPAVSPNGDTIAFTTGGAALYLVDVDGSNVQQVASGVQEAAWSPDGAYLAYVSLRDGLHVHDLSNGETIQLTNSPRDTAPAWSPDGRYIAFSRFVDPGNAEIFVVQSDGGSEQRLTVASEDDYSPTWSPDGRHIAFGSNRDGTEGLWFMGTDGTGQTKVTAGVEGIRSPVWLESAV